MGEVQTALIGLLFCEAMLLVKSSIVAASER